jgi:hypothetical protein
VTSHHTPRRSGGVDLRATSRATTARAQRCAAAASKKAARIAADSAAAIVKESTVTASSNTTTEQTDTYDDFQLFHYSGDHRTAYSTRTKSSDDDLFHNTTEYNHNDATSGQFRAYSLEPDEFCLHNKKSDDFIDFDSLLVFSVAGVESAPITLAEARLRDDAKYWIASYEDEVRSLKERETWTVRRWRDIPPGRRAIRCKLVFKKKMIGDQLDKYKCRIVAKGFSQVKGVDFHNTWAPTVRKETVNACLAHAATCDLEIDQSDVSTAFLYPPLEELLFMQMPEGMPSIDDDGEKLVLQLEKCLYGLKQSANAWFAMLRDHIVDSMGFTQSDSDPCLFFKDIDGHRYLLLTFVDDILIIGKHDDIITTIRNQLTSKFKMTHQGPVAWFLQMEVTRDRVAHTITLNNRHKIYALLEQHGMFNCNPVTTPMLDGKVNRLCNFNPDLLPPGADTTFQNYPYREIIGGLLHISTTRPDIQLAVQQLCKYMHRPGPNHVAACKRTLRYLRGTSDLGLTFGGISPHASELRGYADADWANDPDNRTSITGYTLFLGSSCINSVAKNQDRIALSSTEAEYIALSACASKVVWMRQILADIGIPQIRPTVIYEDNEPCIDLAHNAILSARTMHVDVKFHKTRERIRDGFIDIRSIATGDNTGDSMTKPLGRVKFQKFRDQLMLGDSSPWQSPKGITKSGGRSERYK